MLSSGDERARASGPLIVCAEIWEMFACRALGWICQREAQIEWVGRLQG